MEFANLSLYRRYGDLLCLYDMVRLCEMQNAECRMQNAEFKMQNSKFKKLMANGQWLTAPKRKKLMANG